MNSQRSIIHANCFDKFDMLVCQVLFLQNFKKKKTKKKNKRRKKKLIYTHKIQKTIINIFKVHQLTQTCLVDTLYYVQSYDQLQHANHLQLHSLNHHLNH